MKFQDILVKNIVVGEQQIRLSTWEDDIVELAADIARNGLMQPIGVTPIDDGRYQLLWGSRRLRAFKHLRRSTIPAHVVPPDQVESVKSVAIRENVHRLQMSLKEECEAVAHLHEKEGLSIEQVAERLGKSRNWVCRRLSVPNMDPEIADMVLAETLPLRHAEIIHTLKDEQARLMLAWNSVQQRWTENQLKAAVDAYNSSPNIEQAVEAGLESMRRESGIPRMLIVCECCGGGIPPVQVRLVRVCPECVGYLTEFFNAFNSQQMETHENGNTERTTPY